MNTEKVLQLDSFIVQYRDSIRSFIYPDLELQAGECLALMGRSASGKTTLLNAVFDYRFPGEITYRRADLLGRDFQNWGSEKYRFISYLPQYAQSGLNPALKIGEQLSLVAAQPYAGPPAKQTVSIYLDEMALTEGIKQLYPYQLSGGMKQRLAIVMGFLKKPKLFVLDEPSSALDYLALRRIKSFLHKRKNEGCALLVVSHHQGFINGLTDRLAFLGKENANE